MDRSRRFESEGNKDAVEEHQNKKITYEDEDILISIILKNYDVIEDKSTNSLSQKQQQQQIEAWEKVQQEFSHETKVS